MEKILRKKLGDGGFSGVSSSRSKTMASIRGRDNRTTELLLRLALVRAGLSGWQMHRNDLAGCPDFYFTRARLAIFVDGCFWHSCPRCGHLPRIRRLYWRTKFERNEIRAKKVQQLLERKGIRVARFWEHEIKRNVSNVASRIAAAVALAPSNRF